jgi:4-hydroxy-tetrahydrodipicolinate reductase
MKIALLGYGKMGHMIEDLARDSGLDVVQQFDVDRTITADEHTRESLKDVNVLIDFSIPDAVIENVRTAAKLHKHLVVGTTGWFDHLPEVDKIVKENDIGLVHASNFSLGINLFYKIIRNASDLFQAFKDYDCFVEEAHHQFKLDAPSGTAINIQDILEKNYGGKKIPVTSVRAGYIPGTHSVAFDSKADTVSLKHTARSRAGFAQGAILAAKWIETRKGLYEFSDILNDILKSSEK